jgi:hypothetical protein
MVQSNECLDIFNVKIVPIVATTFERDYLLRRKKSQIHDLKGIICSNWLLSCALSVSEKMLIVGAFLYYCGKGECWSGCICEVNIYFMT